MWYDDDESAYIYYTGRVEHETAYPNGSDAYNLFTNTKTYLCDYGINYWGRRVLIQNYESHDNERAIFFLGNNLLENGLLNG